MIAKTVETKVETEARKVVEEPAESRKHVTKMHTHIICILLSAFVIFLLMETGLDHNAFSFSFGPVMPQVVMEVLDRIRKL